MMPQNDPFAHVYHRIAEDVSRRLDVELSDADIYEILEARTLGWRDDVLSAVRAEANEYGLAVIA
jgi:hypothetical protein